MTIEFMRALWPDLTEDDARMANENLDAYLELAWEIYEDARLATIDAEDDASYDHGERSILHIN